MSWSATPQPSDHPFGAAAPTSVPESAAVAPGRCARGVPRGNGYILWCKENLARFQSANPELKNPRDIYPIMGKHWKIVMTESERAVWNQRWRDTAARMQLASPSAAPKHNRTQRQPLVTERTSSDNETPPAPLTHKGATKRKWTQLQPIVAATPAAAAGGVPSWRVPLKANITCHQVFVLDDCAIHIVPRVADTHSLDATVCASTEQLGHIAETLTHLMTMSHVDPVDATQPNAESTPTVKLEGRV